jgi:anti-sigma regulatory factor (Ser/Thr protein kinase)
MKVVLSNTIDELERLMSELDTFYEQHGIPPKTAMNVSLVLEEIFSNIVFYAYEDKIPHRIELDMGIHDKELYIQIVDDGKEFNILNVADPDLTLGLEDRKIGGLGIHFVKSLMDDITYTYSGGKNILQLKKNIL